MGFSIVTVFEVLHYLWQGFCGKFRTCLNCKKSSCCRDNELIDEEISPISRQSKRGTSRHTQTTTDITIMGGHCVRSPDSTSKHKRDRSICCCVDGKDV